MTKQEIKEYLIKVYQVVPRDLKGMSKEELEELLENLEDTTLLFPNRDENDGSHEWD